ncbi:MAG: disulfide bond formation protein B [Methylobacteriaceae bacterium]|jgi:disulfide bond formation protein DsbB|nr:disulfide bond formation protein B [Methylobacteriaceae bacterium]
MSLPAAFLTPSPRHGILAVGGLAAAVLAGALFFQFVLGIAPCELCYQQRYAYYGAIVLCAAASFAPERFHRPVFLILALMFAATAVLAAYHAGVEWKFWAGPTTCAAPLGAEDPFADLEDILNKPMALPSCSEASWRFLGLSLAGWNALICSGLTLLNLWLSFVAEPVAAERRPAKDDEPPAPPAIA